MMALQCSAIVDALVAEELPVLIDAAPAFNEQHPVVVATLVPQVPEKRTVRLCHGLALALSLDRIRLANGDGDESVEVASERVADEIEGQRHLPDGRPVKWQSKAQERVDKALLRPLEAAPGF